MNKVCENCGAEIKKIYSTNANRFCCAECWHAYRKGKRVSDLRKHNVITQKTTNMADAILEMSPSEAADMLFILFPWKSTEEWAAEIKRAEDEKYELCHIKHGDTVFHPLRGYIKVDSVTDRSIRTRNGAHIMAYDRHGISSHNKELGRVLFKDLEDYLAYAGHFNK